MTLASEGVGAANGVGRALRASRGDGGLLLRTAGCLLGLMLAVVLLCGGRAWGATGHEFLSSVSEAPPGSKLVGPATVAVEHGSGRVFVGDLESGFVDVYDASGEFVTRFGEGGVEAAGIAVDEANGDVYVADPFDALVLVYAPDGADGYRLLAEWAGTGVPGKEFGEVTGVAVDNSKGPSTGDVYVVESAGVDVEGGVVDVFKPKPNPAEFEEGEGEEGQFLKRLAGPKLEEPNGVVVSPSSGRVLVADGAKGMIVAYSASGVFEEKLTGKGSPFGSFKGKEEEEGNVAGLAVDEASGEIYVAETERHVVSQYSSTGVWEGWMTQGQAGPLGEPRGVAVTPAGDVYIADAGLAVVDLFGPTVLVPGVETAKVAKSGLTRISVVLAGTINGDGKPAKYRFQYGETGALGSETASQASGAGEETVSTTVQGLHAGRSYFYRIAGENENGLNYGLVREFVTPPAVEGLATGLVKNLKPDSATLSGKLTPDGFDAHYFFEYGTTAAYGSTSPAPPGTDAGAGAVPVEAETDLAGLKANTLYHYRLVAENSFGSTQGEDKTFTTSGSPRITNEPTTAVGHEEATLNAKVTPDQLATTYRFEYGETTAYGSEVPLGGASIGSGAVAVPVTATLSGLKLGTTYHFRVIATNEAGTTTGADQKLTTIPPAPVDATYATAIRATGATLHALINPLGNPTIYQFQYGTQSCEANPGACANLPSPPEDIGSGSEDVARSIPLTGLTPNTTYHYRVRASNILGTTEGTEHTFTTQEQQAAPSLPDGRAWEMVSPPDKQGAPVEGLTREGGLIVASQDGDKMTYVVDGALGEEVQGNRSPEWQQVIATRGPSVWRSQDIATPSSKAKGASPGNAPEYQFFTPDLSTALVEPVEAGAEPPLAPGVTQATIYLRDNASATFLPVVNETNTAPGTQFGTHVHFVSAVPDLSHIVLASSIALSGAESGPGLYEWSGGQIRFLSVLPDGAQATGQAELGFFGRVLANAISRDGERIIWTKKEDNTGKGHLYMRDVARSETIQLDAAQGTAEPEKGSAQYQAASSDGSRVFFTDKQRLTADSTAEASQTSPKPDLYECEIVEQNGKLGCHLIDLTVDHNEGEHATVQNFIFGASDDGTNVFLVAKGVLASNENGNGEEAEATKNNLYELHFEGGQWATRFIAMLSGEDGPEWEGGTTKADTAFLTARVSPNGRYLAFMSAAPITGYDNIDANPVAKGSRDEEVYLYDSTAASLRCVSCNPTGGRPAGVLDTNESGEGLGLLVDRRKVWGELSHEHWLAGNIPGWTPQSLTSALFQSRYLSDEGRLYFNSPDELVPAASNGKENVYQFEPAGVGSCQSPTGGCVSLLSAGNSDRESAFVEATPNGDNVFFVTEERLLSQDTDTAFDIYDARECRAQTPCQTPPEPAKPGCGDNEACRPAQPPQQLPGPPAGTGTFSGSGNIVFPQPHPQGEAKAITKTVKPPTRAQKLAKALANCRKQHAHAKKKRAGCERRARKRYGAHRTQPAAMKNGATKSSRKGSRA